MKPKTMQVQVRHVRNLVNPGKDWCVQWQSSMMSAPAFWYFETQAAAQAAAMGLLEGRKR